jgi:CHC2 zinc finger
MNPVASGDTGTGRAINSIADLKADVDFRSLVVETHTINHSSKVLCPFHSDTSPSCHIYPDGFKCYSCGASGDALDWLEQVQGYSKVDAVKELERRSGIITEPSPRRERTVSKPLTLCKSCESEPLPMNVTNLHLKRASRLDYIPLSLEGRGFTLEDLQALQLASENDDALIPIFRPDGLIVAIKCRRYTLKDKEQRYVYLTAKCGTPAWCSPNFSRYDTVLIIEGELNAAICYVVYPEMAYMGVAGTGGCLWLETLKGKQVYVYADGDKAGQKARDRWAQAACDAGARKVLLVDSWEMDACEIAGKHGRDVLREKLL